jgi:uncharacterized protein (TIGR02268 family)
MPVSSTLVLGVLVLFVSVPALAQPVLALPRPEGRRIELPADGPGDAAEVLISPGLSTTFFFDTPLQRGGMRLDRREHFRVVSLGEEAQVLNLLPGDELRPGDVVRLTVRFADDALPEGATFTLRVQAASAEHQVEVYRQPRDAASYRREARAERERAQQCLEALERVRVEQGAPAGLTGLRASGGMDTRGVSSTVISDGNAQRPGAPLHVGKAVAYGARRRGLLDLSVDNLDARPWTVEAELVGKGGVRWKATVWPSTPIPPGARQQQLLVEMELPEAEARGPFTLELREAGGSRSVLLGGVRFP